MNTILVGIKYEWNFKMSMNYEGHTTHFNSIPFNFIKLYIHKKK